MVWWCVLLPWFFHNQRLVFKKLPSVVLHDLHHPKRIKPCSATERTLNVENGDEKFFETLFAEVWHVDTILQKCQERNVQSLETNMFAWLPCSLLPIFDDSPGWFSNGAQWESLRWSQVLLWILWQQQLSRSKLMLLLLFLSSTKTVYRFIAYMMNPHRQFKQKQRERQLQFFIADSSLMQNQTAAVHVSSTSRNYYSKGLHNFNLCDSKKLNLFVLDDW